LSSLADEVVCARVPQPFTAVGQWYLDFNQTTDEEVVELLRDHARNARTAARP
jgi:putative phosphoribosyl transferase